MRPCVCPRKRNTHPFSNAMNARVTFGLDSEFENLVKVSRNLPTNPPHKRSLSPREGRAGRERPERDARVAPLNLARGIYAASASAGIRSLKRHKCRAPRRASWGASTISESRIGTRNRKRQQAGRTPNASRSSGIFSLARERLECAELPPSAVLLRRTGAPAFAAGSWGGGPRRNCPIPHNDLRSSASFVVQLALPRGLNRRSRR